jgi:predicted glycogen debranching enzyme
MPISFDSDVTADFDAASSREWLEANGLGGWASGTISGAHTRRYHGLLVAATHPPGGRMVLLSKLPETLAVEGERFELDANRFEGAVHPQGFRLLRRFELDPFPTFIYEAGGARLRKTIAAIHGENTTVILYEVERAKGPVTVELRPLVAYRDYHGLQHANDGIRFANASFRNGVFRARPYEGAPELFLSVPGSAFEARPDWYFRFEYAIERERGLDAREDLFCYGVFRRELAPGERFGVIVSTGDTAGRDPFELADRERARRRLVTEAFSKSDELTRTLALAADAFVVRRGEDLRTIIAGYPWFADWGRDTMIALPGICLSTGRPEDAKKILRAFARSASQGMLPNRFPDTGEAPEYNSVDATLWFFVAAWRYLEATGDLAFAQGELLPVLLDIVAWHDRGTRYGIKVDADGLLRAGEPGIQLTWMDSKIGDWVVTPRAGKPVEIQALWYNALSILSEIIRRAGREAEAEAVASRAARVKSRFSELFWNAAAGCLYDVVDGDARDGSVRPNQVFALSLPFPLLAKDQAKSVLAVIDAKLKTPVGLRSLSPDDPAYRGRYEGGPAERDAVYHQGTVWSWLLGPYCDALVQHGGASGKAKARKTIEALAPHLLEAGLGTISEIFDGDPPHAPRGCFAQAWSVGEALRVYKDTTIPAKKKPYKVVTPRTETSPRKARGKTADA